MKFPQRVKDPLDFAPAVGIIMLALLLPAFSPFLFGGKALYQGDIFLYFEPALRYMAESVRSGRLPLWNPLVCGGVPQIAIVSPGIFYPPNLLFAVLPFGAALGAVLMVHQWIAGMGAYLFLRECGRTPGGATIGAISVALSGYMFGSSQCYTLPATFAWTPVGLYLIALIVRCGRLYPGALLAVVFGLQILAGRPEMFLAAGVIYGAYAAFALVAKPGTATDAQPAATRAKPATARLRLACLAVVSLVLGIAIAAVALLPVLELYSLSPRVAGLRYGDVSLWSAGWFDWLQMILTRPFGDLVVSKYYLSPHYPGLFPYISSLFLGAPILTLALFGLVDKSFSYRWLWVAIGFAFVLLALGKFGPLLPFLYELSPSLAVLRYPIKLAAFALFAFSILAAAGWDAVLSGRVPGLAYRLSAVFWFAVALCGNAVFLELGDCARVVAQAVLGGRDPQLLAEMQAVVRACAAQLCMVSALGLLITAMVPLLTPTLVHRRFNRKVLIAFMAFVTVQPLLMNGPACLWHMTDQKFYEEGSPVADWLNAQKKEQGDFRMLAFLPDVILSPKSMWRPDDAQEHSIMLSRYERQILEADCNMDFGLPSSYGFMPTDTRAFLMLYVGVASRSCQYMDKERVGPVSDAPLHLFCQLTNTRYLINTTTRPDKARHVLEPMPALDSRYFQVAHEFPELDLRIYQIEGTPGRVYFRESWQAVPSQVEALKEIFWADKSSFDPATSVLVNSEGGTLTIAPPPAPAAAAGAQATARIASDTGERVEVDVDCAKAGFLVLADTYYPGWKAYDGERPLTLYQANGFQKAVFLEPGAHKVTFAYRPYSLFWGEFISLSALLICVLVVVLEAAFFGKRLMPGGPEARNQAD